MGPVGRVPSNFGGHRGDQVYLVPSSCRNWLSFFSNFIRQRVIERKNNQKTIYNKDRNTIDMQDYQAVTYKINGK